MKIFIIFFLFGLYIQDVPILYENQLTAVTNICNYMYTIIWLHLNCVMKKISYFGWHLNCVCKRLNIRPVFADFYIIFMVWNIKLVNKGVHSKMRQLHFSRHKKNLGPIWFFNRKKIRQLPVVTLYFPYGWLDLPRSCTDMLIKFFLNIVDGQKPIFNKNGVVSFLYGHLTIR